jgi:WD40 repeat protein
MSTLRGCFLSLLLLIPVLSVLAAAGGDEVKRIPVPAKTDLAKSESLVKDIFKEDMAKAKDAEAKVKLASELLVQGDQCKDPADRYTCFREAKDWAAKAGDATLALSAVERLTRHFDVSALELKTATLSLVAEHTESQDAAKALLDMVLPLVADAVDADNYMLALQLGDIAQTAAKKAKSEPLAKAVRERVQEVRAAEKSFSHLQPFIDRLKKDPKDAEANLELGKYFGLFKGKWDKALPFLAAGSDADLKKLAALDLKKPASGKEQVLIGDGWWELAAKEKSAGKLNLQRRAAFWYEKSLVDLRGLSRLKATKRLDQIAGVLVASNNVGGDGPVGELAKFEGHTDEIRAVAFSHDGRYAASAGLDQNVRVWDLQAKKDNLVAILKGHTKQIWSVAFHPNNREVFSGSWDATARRWDIKSGNEVKQYRHDKDVNGIAVSRDGDLLVTGCDIGSALLWKTAGDEVRRYPGFTNYVYCVALSPNGRYIAAGSNDKTARVFDTANATVVKSFEGFSDPIMAVALSPDNRFLYLCGDSAAHQFEIATGKEVRKYEGKVGRVLTLALSSDGRRLLTAGDGKMIQLWDTNTGKQLKQFSGHTDTINSVSFSPDNHRAISGGLDRTVRVWGLPR